MTPTMLRLAALAATLAAAPAAEAQPRGGTIPAQFHGRWADSAQACRRADPNHPVITIERSGWQAPMEQQGRVTAVGPVRGGTHSFSVHDWAGPSEADGVMTLRRVGSRLSMTLAVAGGAPTRHDMVRCR